MGARTSTSTPSAKEANEAWKDVPSLAQKHLAETGEDKNQKGMLGAFIDISGLIPTTYPTGSRRG